MRLIVFLDYRPNQFLTIPNKVQLALLDISSGQDAGGGSAGH